MKERLETKRLLLREFREDDALMMFSNWANDPKVTEYMTWEPHNNIEVTKFIINKWLEKYNNPKTVRFAITLKDTKELIGSIDIVAFIDDKPEIGYCLSRKYWNQGIMTEACNAVVDYIFSLGYQEIVIEAHVDNIGSNRVIQKCGFVFTHQETRPCSEIKPEMITVNWYKKVKNN